jgi:uncharacterized delta-60 repeat protein
MKLMQRNISFMILVATVWATTPVASQVLTPHADSSFAQVGYTFLDENKYFIPQHQIYQPDGKILVGGYGEETAQTATFNLILYRLNADGSRDNTFGNNGLWTYDISGTHEAIEAIAVLPDQKILMVCNENHRIILIRLLPDGSFDPDFGLEGIFLTAADETEYAEQMVVQPDGKIVIVGWDVNQAQISRAMIRRFNADGSVDMEFGINGYRDITIDPSQNFELNRCVLQPDGKIVATGPYSTLEKSGFPVVRLNTDGSFDQTFSDDGVYFKLLGTTNRTAYAEDLAIQPDGKIVVVGYAPKTPNPIETNMAVMRLRPEGTVESSFGNFGIVRIVYTSFSDATKVVIQPDNKILLGGFFYISDTSTYCSLTRLKANGQLDPTFGLGDGKYAHLFGNEGFPVERLNWMSFDENQKLLETIWLNNTVNLGSSTDAQCAMIRYNTDITVKAHDAKYQIKSAKLSPNLVAESVVTLEYTLDTPAEVTVSLFDMNGAYVCNLVPSSEKTAGLQTESFFIPEEVPAGTYLTVISGGVDYQTLELVKVK